MKKILLTLTILLFALCFGGVADAAEAPPPKADPVAELPTTAVETEVEAVPSDTGDATCESTVIDFGSLDQILDGPETTNVCSCIDLCRSDAQCELFYGPGSTCEPQGPCDCKECVASM